MTRQFRRLAAAIALTLAAALSIPPSHAQAQAQTWPDRSVKWILPFGAGSATDIAARLLAERLSAKWGKPVVIENRPGGDGLVAINAFTSANDDHVLLYASSASFMAHPYTQEKLPYDLQRDLAPIARVCDTVVAASVPAASEFKTIAEFAARAKAEPGKYHAAGAAGVPEFSLGAFIKSENLDVTKVPYRDVVQAGRDLGEQRIHFLLSSYAVVRPLIEAGKVRVVGAGGRKRAAITPNVPSVLETGYPTLVTETTSGLYGPKGMALALRERIAADVIAAASDPAAAGKIVASGQDMNTGGPADLTATLKQQGEALTRVAKILGMERKQ
jgi:tripartite-type tricarboxylate transporter receptor subunit TctC